MARGGFSRPVGGAPTLQGAPTYDFGKISEKLHENKKRLVRRQGWGGAGCGPPRPIYQWWQ